MTQGGEVQQIVRELQEGHQAEENFHRLFDRYYRPVRFFFLERGASPEETLDLTQETFLRAFQGIDSFRGDSSFEWWLRNVAANVWRMRVRSLRAGKRSADETLEPGPSEARTAVEGLTSLDSDPLALSLREEQGHVLRQAIGDLPPQMRRVLILRYYQGLKYREIADLMGVALNTVKSQLSQAVSRLRSTLAEEIDLDR